MELKRYLEADSKLALEKIRRIHGDDALSVLSYREIPDDQSIRIVQTIELNETSEE